MRHIRFAFRFPVVQTGERHIDLEIPEGIGGVQVLSNNLVETYKLSDKEIEAAEEAVLREIAIVR